MSRFNAPPPNGDSRKMIEQRARDATRPAAPEKKGSWPFSANKTLFGMRKESSPDTGTGQDKNTD